MKGKYVEVWSIFTVFVVWLSTFSKGVKEIFR